MKAPGCMGETQHIGLFDADLSLPLVSLAGSMAEHLPAEVACHHDTGRPDCLREGQGLIPRSGGAIKYLLTPVGGAPPDQGSPPAMMDSC